MIDAQDLWKNIAKILKMQISDTDFNTFFFNIEANKIEGKTLLLNIESNLLKTNIESKYKEKIEELLKILSNDMITNFGFNIKKEDIKFDNYYTIVSEQRHINNHNPKSRFDNYVVGKNNELAKAACLAVAENSGVVYNPLLIYGGSGLGKTHLMQAVGNAILLENPNKRVLYSSSENFSNEYISSLRAGHFSNNQIQNVQNFRDKFRTLDVLLIDDIQFFERVFGQGTGSVEEEFFHTFNALQEQGKQIIMSSDRLPKEIKNLSSRLESRFISGLSVEVQQPDYETRVAILQNIANERRALIPNEVLEYIATSINSNVRELEGVINGIMARANLLRLPYTLELAQEELINKIKKQQSKITAEKIISVVSNHYSISIEDMKAKKKQKEIVQARQVAMFLLKEKLDMNLTTIGGHFGGKDHSTVISSIRKIEEAIKEEFLFKKEIEGLRQKIVE